MNDLKRELILSKQISKMLHKILSWKENQSLGFTIFFLREFSLVIKVANSK